MKLLIVLLLHADTSVHLYFNVFLKICVYIQSMFLMISMFSLTVIYTIVQLKDALFNRYNLVSLTITV
jgi:hypothetical protein